MRREVTNLKSHPQSAEMGGLYLPRRRGFLFNVFKDSDLRNCVNTLIGRSLSDRICTA